MKKKTLASLLLISSTAALAQHPTVVSIGGGPAWSSSDMKAKSYMGNGYNLQGDVFIPINKGRFAWGVIAGGTYNNSQNLMPDAGTVQAAYKVYNGNLDITGEKKAAAGFTASAGLQAAFALGRFILSPSFSGGYFSLKQKGYVQQAQVNSKPVILAQSPETKHTGFIAIPQIRISYPLTGCLGIYASTAFLLGPEITTTQQRLVPAGGFNDQHTYEPTQLSSGTLKSGSAQTNYRTLNANAGISLNIGSSSRRLKGKVTKPGDNGAKQANPLYEPSGSSQQNPMHGSGAMARPGQPIKGVIVKGGKNPGGSSLIKSSNDMGEFELNALEAGEYQFVLTAPESPQGKSINEKGVKRVEASEMAKPGQPIKGVIVKGGKNPGVDMTNLRVDNNGTIQFEVLEAGDYKFIIQTPESPNQQNKKVVEKATSGLKDTLKTNV
ncbi:MAG TPA: hypothetical protein VHN59_10390 [Chitinophagaceae bacterium]|nr:hypothetical protein [Chitinophagaceae bacterium]